MSVESVKKYLEKWQLQDRVQEFEVSSATVELAALALSTEPARIAKTITFRGEEKPIIVVAAGDTKIDNSKFKSTFGLKARMLTKEEAYEATGHAVGGVCPFDLKEGNAVYLDDSLKRFDTVFPACGSSNSCIEVTIEELELTTPYIDWVDVCK